MSHDDDLMKNQNQSDDFEFDSSEEDSHTIPDTPWQDDDQLEVGDDLLGGDNAAEEFDLGDLDAPIEEAENVIESADAAEHSNYSGSHEQGGYQEEPEPEVEEEDDGPEAVKLGWKTYLGLGVAAVVTVGGLAAFMYGGGDSAQRQAQQASFDGNMNQGQVIRESAQPQAQQQSQVAPQQAQNNAGQGGSAPQMPQNNTQSGGTTQGAPQMAGGSNGNGGMPNNTGGEPSMGGSNPELVISAAGDQSRAQTNTTAEINKDDILAMVEDDFVLEEDFVAIKDALSDQGRDLSSLRRNLSSTDRTVEDLKDRIQALETEQEKLADLAKSESAGGDTSRAEDSATPQPDPEVQEAQIRLKAYNYRPGPIDGLMGDRTIAAIKRFQKQHGLSVTGELDNSTLERLSNNPETFAGQYRAPQRTQTANRSSSEKNADHDSWFVRGVTPSRAIIYQESGKSYPVSVGTEVPGFGQVTELNPDSYQVVTTKGTIRLQ